MSDKERKEVAEDAMRRADAAREDRGADLVDRKWLMGRVVAYLRLILDAVTMPEGHENGAYFAGAERYLRWVADDFVRNDAWMEELLGSWASSQAAHEGAEKERERLIAERDNARASMRRLRDALWDAQEHSDAIGTLIDKIGRHEDWVADREVRRAARSDDDEKEQLP